MIHLVLEAKHAFDIVPRYADQQDVNLTFPAKIFRSYDFRQFAAKQLGENVEDFTASNIAAKLWGRLNLTVFSMERL